MKKLATGILSFLFLIGHLMILSAQSDCAKYTLLQSDIGNESETFGVSLADFNGDGWKDVVIIDAYNEIEVYFYNPANGRMDTLGQHLGGDAWRFGVEVLDIENDGDWDFITVPFSSSSGNGIEVWENGGQGNFTLKADGVGGSSTSGHEFAVGDVDGDGFTDIFFPHGDIDILLNDGTGSFFSSGQNNLSLTSPEGAVLADLDADGDLDAVVVGGYGAKIFLNDGDGIFSESNQELSEDDEGVDAADIDGDGDIDLVIAPWIGSVKIFLNDGAGHFAPGYTLDDINSFFIDVVLADQNFDGYPDIFTNKRLWLNDASHPGQFILQDFNITISSHDFEVTDINNDGFLDMYVGRFSHDEGDNIYLSTPSEIDNNEVAICVGDSLLIGNEWQTAEGVYIENLGCDSFRKTSLSLFDEINTDISRPNASTLSVGEANATYQWLDCDNNFSPIEGATSQDFSPSQNGYYAVEVTTENCTAISDCQIFTQVGTSEGEAVIFNIYPNPTKGTFSIESTWNIKTIKVVNTMGKVLQQTNEILGNTAVDLSAQPSGIYFVKIQIGEEVFSRKIIKE